MLNEELLDKIIQIAVHDRCGIAGLVTGAMVLDHVVRMKYIGANLAAPGNIHLGAFQFFQLFLFFLELFLVKLGQQYLHGSVSIAVLRPLVLALYNDARRDVRDAHGRAGLVHVLASGAAGPISVDAQILFVNVDFDGIVDFRVDEYRGKRGVAPLVGIEWGNAHQSMDARLGF